MKKLLALLLALAMVLALASCGSSTESAAETPAESATASESSAPAEDAAASESAAPAEDAAVYKIGIVNYVDDASLNQIVANVESELDAKAAELGVVFEYEPYYDNAQADASVLPQIGADLVDNEVDAIVAIATPVASAMLSAVEDTDIPVIFAAVSDPVGAGLADSMEASGVNMTGTSDALDTTAIMKLMLAANPDLSLVGLLYDTAQDSSTAAIEAAKTFLDENNIAYEEKTGTTVDDIMLAAESLIADQVQAVFTPTDNSVMTAELSIYEKFAEAQIPHYTGADSFALNGAFLGYGVDYANLGRVTADVVVDIVVNGMDASTYPIVTFDNGTATINTETCAAIGFDLATIEETFAPLCTQVIEIQTAEEFE